MFSEVLSLCMGVLQIPHQSLTRAELLRDLSILGYLILICPSYFYFINEINSVSITGYLNTKQKN